MSSPAVSQLVIRPMQASDLEQVMLIEQVSFSLPWPISSYRYELNENPHSLLWVAEMYTAESAPQVVGMLVEWLILDEAHIATIAVDPAWRRQGTAEKLIQTALAAAIRAGCIEATLEVRIGNLAAQQLYRRFGFEVLVTRPRYYLDNNEDALIMTVTGLSEQYLSGLDTINEAAGEQRNLEESEDEF